MKPRVTARRSGKTVAVVGSGPAGLMVAALLNQRGHTITVYERDARPGGLLVYGIPNMKLPKLIVSRRIELLEAEGVRFACNTDVPADISLDALACQNDAVVLAVGAQQPRALSFEGRAAGVCYALDYLAAAARDYLGERRLDAIMDARDKTVAVVGAGDTANDCIATALRQGAADVVQLIRRPAEHYGATTDYAHEEAEAALRRDIRCFSSQVTAVSAGEDGSLQRVSLSTADGPRDIDAQLLVIASGFDGAERYALEGIDLSRYENIFQAGDMVTGASLVVCAMSQARKTARQVDEHLLGYSTIR